MIVTMKKLRILGLRSRLTDVIEALQDVGVVHLCSPDIVSPLTTMPLDPAHARHVRHIETSVDDVEECLSRLDRSLVQASAPLASSSRSLVREVRFARRARRAVVALAVDSQALAEERDRLEHYIRIFSVFVDLPVSASTRATRTLFLVLSEDSTEALERLRQATSALIGDSFTIYSEPLSPDEVAVALVVSAADLERVEGVLPEVGVNEIDLPPEFAHADFASSLRAMRQRLGQVEAELEDVAGHQKRLAEELVPGLLRARITFEDWLRATEAMKTAAATPHLFVLEGWVPAEERDTVERSLRGRADDAFVIEDVGRESWAVQEIPVEISNPRIFRPFEVITRTLPLPRYGTMDPTPFVAVFFPMFFGLILGDVGYGAVLGGLSAVGWSRSVERSLMRSISEIAACCAAFSMTFGLLFGEFFGDLGHRWFGMQAFIMSREDTFIPFLSLALAIGFVHIVLGLILGAFSGLRTDIRRSLGRGLTAGMLVVTAAMLLAAINVLPEAFFTPLAIALLASFVLLIFIEGAIGPIEFLSRLSNILSYARIMALGTASVMLAIVANRMVGAMGGAIVGVVFATLFHVVNFGLGVFSPSIHALRLHYVEFFGTFYSPGGIVYQPFRHWKPNHASAP